MPLSYAERHALPAGVPPGSVCRPGRRGPGGRCGGRGPDADPARARPREFVSPFGHSAALWAQVRHFPGHFARYVHGTCAQSGGRLSPGENPRPAGRRWGRAGIGTGVYPGTREAFHQRHGVRRGISSGLGCRCGRWGFPTGASRGPGLRDGPSLGLLDLVAASAARAGVARARASALVVGGGMLEVAVPGVPGAGRERACPVPDLDEMPEGVAGLVRMGFKSVIAVGDRDRAELDGEPCFAPVPDSRASSVQARSSSLSAAYREMPSAPGGLVPGALVPHLGQPAGPHGAGNGDGAAADQRAQHAELRRRGPRLGGGPREWAEGWGVERRNGPFGKIGT